jgi:hypothetical protein
MKPSEIKQMWDNMAPSLNERMRRQFAAVLASAYGYGGATVVHQQTGIALNTITAGKKELKDQNYDLQRRVRRPGGGAKLAEEHFPELQNYIRAIVDDFTYGDPERVISYTTQSYRRISDALLDRYNIKISHCTVGSILVDMKYSKHTNQKMLQVGLSHPDRNGQFEFINAKTKQFLVAGNPVISVDTKKKELLGNFKNPGKEYRKSGDPRKVLDHDFPIKELGKIAPYGVYILNNNIGFVNLGISHDTAEFSVESISRWWECLGKTAFPNATELFITCDCGGSNGYRLKLWKYQLSQLARRISLDIHVSHFPPGTSKWNKVEHKLFCYISKNWEGKPLINVQTAVSLIGSTTTRQGLKVTCVQDDTVYELAKKVSDDEYASISLTRIQPFELWNYIIGKS